MGSSKKPKDSNYMNMESLRNQPWVRSAYETATNSTLSPDVELTQKQALDVCGQPVVMVEMYFTNHPVLCLTGYALDLRVDRRTYKAEADLEKASSIRSSGEINKDGMSLQLSATRDEIVSILEKKEALNAKVVVYSAILDPDDNVAVMFSVHKGRIKTSKLKDDPIKGIASITIKTISVWADLNKVPGTRSAPAIHKARHPNDTFWDQVNVSEDEEWKHSQG
ncbi:hypothetical protein ACU5B6_04770 [Moritella viscosa]|uniref:hypothetical protein n=1 Tax=Moritella viscosa TaxID=80854 RepID=UPI000918CC92|nr:hypothetical protein [Moritella viscosa]SHO02437.1 Putative uncharacterized protein [Moritella viscosa]SHO07124.1 Putative uncharacterized protein [Moritella viscosa]